MASKKKMTMGLIVGNRGLFPDHRANAWMADAKSYAQSIWNQQHDHHQNERGHRQFGHTVLWSTRARDGRPRVELDFAEESFGAFGNQGFPGVSKRTG